MNKNILPRLLQRYHPRWSKGRRRWGVVRSRDLSEIIICLRRAEPMAHPTGAVSRDWDWLGRHSLKCNTTVREANSLLLLSPSLVLDSGRGAPEGRLSSPRIPCDFRALPADSEGAISPGTACSPHAQGFFSPPVSTRACKMSDSDTMPLTTSCSSTTTSR